MMRATELAHILIRQSVNAGDLVIDATVGNGHDTLLLGQLVGPNGRVLGFDVQQAALAQAARIVDGMSQVTLIHAGHEKLGQHLSACKHNRLTAVMFNLGYLPGAPGDIMTGTPTTLAALEQTLPRLEVHGLVTLVLYRGHPGGAQEAQAVRSYAKKLPQAFAATHHSRLNASSLAPELLVIERLRS